MDVHKFSLYFCLMMEADSYPQYENFLAEEGSAAVQKP
jgi:hypothetical protein